LRHHPKLDEGVLAFAMIITALVIAILFLFLFDQLLAILAPEWCIIKSILLR